MEQEKIIMGFEHCREYGSLGGNNCNGHYAYTDDMRNIVRTDNHRNDCPYGQCEAGCITTLIGDVTTLLKKQRQTIAQLRRDKEVLTSNYGD